MFLSLQPILLVEIIIMQACRTGLSSLRAPCANLRSSSRQVSRRKSSFRPRSRTKDELSSQFARSYKDEKGFGAKFARAYQDAKRDYPIVLPVLIIATTASLGLLGLVGYDSYTRVSSKVKGYPEPVEYQLRRALHAIYVRPDPDKAMQFFTEAIKVAEEVGMDPYSMPVLGIRIRLAEAMEKFGRAKGAIEVLQGVVKMCEERVADIDRGTNVPEPAKATGQRQEMVKQIIQNKVKIAALYESDYVQDTSSAKATMSDAIALLTKESKDPHINGFSEDNTAGLSLSEIASMLSQMGDLYATTGEEENAVQVYMLTLQPLRASCNGTRSCKEVQVMSNIASTMDVAMKKPGVMVNGKPATAESLAAARRATLMWADQAIKTAEVVRPEDRDEICEMGMISASMTKADLLLMDGKLIQAREAWRSLLPSLREKNLDGLVKVAEDGIRRAGG